MEAFSRQQSGNSHQRTRHKLTVCGTKQPLVVCLPKTGMFKMSIYLLALP